jgi:hypothetical protein
VRRGAGALVSGLSTATCEGGDTHGHKQPSILILFGDDIGMWNTSYWSRGMMGYRTPNIDRVGNEGVAFTDYYAQQSCTAGRAAFITGQNEGTRAFHAHRRRSARRAPRTWSGAR